MQWTPAQQEAITAEGSDILVSAAAGSGKTAVLVARVLRKLTDPVAPTDVDRLLIVTFTKAAAGEMRERIREALMEKAGEAENQHEISRQLALLNHAHITTIDSYCTSLLRTYFDRVGLDPAFRVAEETEATLLKAEAMETLLEKCYDEEDSDAFYALVEAYGFGGGKEDRDLAEILLKCYEFLRSLPWPEKWLREMAVEPQISGKEDFAETVWGKYLMHFAKGRLQKALDLAKQGMELTEEDPMFSGYFEAFKADAALFEWALSATDSWDHLYEVLGTLKFQSLRGKKGADPEFTEQLKALRGEEKDAVNPLTETIFRCDSTESLEEMRRLAPSIALISKLTLAFGEEYTALKREKKLVDFGDLGHLCLELLLTPEGERTDIALSEQRKFDEIMIDEYQDSNEVQECILQAVSAGKGVHNVFMVGDIKQSIYRFRQADPTLFNRKYRDFSIEPNENGQKILLNRNFRSAREVIDGVNFVFRTVMSPELGEVQYTEDEALTAGADYPELTPGARNAEVLITTTDLEVDDEEKLSRVEAEAYSVGRRICELIQKKHPVWDGKLGTHRPVTYSDIVVLLRSIKRKADVYAEVFTSLGIPVFSDSGIGYFASMEVEVMLSLLEVIDNPMQDIPLAAVLRSPIYGFTTKELAEVRIAAPDGTLYEALTAYAKKDGDLCIKVHAFLEKLHGWQALSAYLPTDELIWRIYTETDFLAYAAGLPDGETRAENLRLLFERAHAYEATSYKGLFHFVRYVRQLKEGETDLASAKIIGENENVVRIMSMHKSKGLEFPVVILAGLGTRFNFKELSGRMLLHRELGFGPELVLSDERIRCTTGAREAVKLVLRQEALSEELRILYVGMTRAKEKLILSGAVNKIDREMTKWCSGKLGKDRTLSPDEMSSASSMLGWVMSALTHHREVSKALGLSVEKTIDDPSKWEVYIREAGVASPISETEERETTPGGSMPKGQKDEALRRLSWEYPYLTLAMSRAKVSVSELKRLHEVEEPDTEYLYPSKGSEPVFHRNGQFTPAEKGSILHFAMQHMAFGEVGTKEEIAKQLSRLVMEQFLTEEEAAVLKEEKISRFFESEIGKRMREAKILHRELSFALNVPRGEVFPEFQDEKYRDETVMVQGMIDACFIEDGEWVIVDYKTDAVTEETAPAAIGRYRVQMDWYEKALVKRTGIPVKEKILYFFALDQAYKA